MALFTLNKSIPTSTAEQSTHNVNIVSVITRIISTALNTNAIQTMINDSVFSSPYEIDNTDSPYTPPVTGYTGVILILVDTTSAAVTVNLPADADVDAGYRFKVVRVAGSNNVTVAQNGNTINGVASDTTISTSYTPKVYTYLGGDDYLEE